MNAEETQLINAIANDLNGRDAYRMYADWLTSRGERFGELINTWLQAEAAPTAEETQRLTDAAMMQADGMHELQRLLVGTTHRWHRGFISAISARLQNFDLAGFLASRPGRCVRKLQLRGDGESISRAVQIIRDARAMGVNEIRFEQRDASIEDEAPALVGLMAQPGLRSLGLSQGRYDFSGFSFHELEHVDVRCSGNVESLHHAWSAGFGSQLRSLEAYDLPLTVDSLMKPLEQTHFTRLLSLALAVSEADEVLRRLAAKPELLKELTSLSVLGPVSEVGFGYMLAKPELFQRISRLEISRRRVRSTFFQKQVLPVFPQLKAVAVQWGVRKYPYQHRALQRVPGDEEW